MPRYVIGQGEARRRKLAEQRGTVAPMDDPPRTPIIPPEEVGQCRRVAWVEGFRRTCALPEGHQGDCRSRGGARFTGAPRTPGMDAPWPLDWDLLGRVRKSKRLGKGIRRKRG